MENIHQHEQEIVSYLLPKMQEMEGVTVYGPRDPENILESLVLLSTESIHMTSQRRSIWKELQFARGIIVAQPLMRWLDVPATCRASFYIYNTLQEAEQFLEALEKVKEFFQYGLI